MTAQGDRPFPWREGDDAIAAAVHFAIRTGGWYTLDQISGQVRYPAGEVARVVQLMVRAGTLRADDRGWPVRYQLAG